MIAPEIVVRGHRLPASLALAIDAGKWQAPDDPVALETVFGARPVRPLFYCRDMLEFENASFDDDPLYLGAPDPLRPPGDIDPARAVLIGDLGPDRPFALDYRADGPPRVVFLTESGGWHEVAPTVDDLLRALGIGE